MNARYLFLIFLVTTAFPLHSHSQSSIESAEASFRYVHSTLSTFRDTGRLVNNPGVDGSDLEAFIELLDFYYEQFSSGFNSDSAMCRFYRDPDNGRMTIEERAADFVRNYPEKSLKRTRLIKIYKEYKIKKKKIKITKIINRK